MTRGLSTGVRALDRKLDGGIPPGTLVTLLADPASQAELLLERFIDDQETVYLTSERTPTAVTTALRDQGGPHDGLVVSQLDRETPIIDAIECIAKLPDEAVFVIDPVDVLERASAGQFRAFLEQLRAALTRTESVAVLHALKHSSSPSQRHRTKYMSDIVFDLVTETTNETIETQLFVPKFRGGRALTDPINVELTDAIAVDTSRDIA